MMSFSGLHVSIPGTPSLYTDRPIPYRYHTHKEKEGESKDREKDRNRQRHREIKTAYSVPVSKISPEQLSSSPYYTPG